MLQVWRFRLPRLEILYETEKRCQYYTQIYQYWTCAADRMKDREREYAEKIQSTGL